MIRPSQSGRVRPGPLWIFAFCLLVSLFACDSRDATAPETEPTPPTAPENSPPYAATLGAMNNATPGTATLHGVINPKGLATEAWFEWGAGEFELSHRTAIQNLSGTKEQVVSAAIASMEPERIYYFRAVARSDAGVRHGATTSFLVQAKAPSPSGTALAFVRAGDIYVYPVDEGGGEVVRLTTGGNFDYPSWSPDGRRIAFVDVAEWPFRIFVINADGSGMQLVGNGHSPAWSPDGRRLAFSALTDGNTAIFVKYLYDEGQPVIRIGFGRGYHDFPAWSPDGTQIAFISDWEAFDFASEVYIAYADGSAVTRLTDGFWGNVDSMPHFTTYRQPSWSPDGRDLAVLACAEPQYFTCGESSVVVLSVNSSGSSLVTEATGLARPTWTPDGSSILFSTTCWDHDCPSDVMQVARGGGDKRLLIENAHSGVWRP